MNLCKDCKHWKRREDDYRGEHVGDCSSDHFVYMEKCPSDGLEYWDYEGYSAGFLTGENFGCVHHAGK